VTRARDRGISNVRLLQGKNNALPDVAGVSVGHTTVIRGSGKRVRGEGPVRTGVTVIVPHDGDFWGDSLFAGVHVLSGVTHPTGLETLREWGTIRGPIALTSSWSVGAVCDALVARGITARGALGFGTPPVVLETWDGILNDVEGQHLRAEHVDSALDGAAPGAVAEGNVGGGTGTICHGFKGGIGTASRVTGEQVGGYSVGVLVQTNHGHRERLSINGVKVGEHFRVDRIPIPERAGQMWGASGWLYPSGKVGSILVVGATDAPLLPLQCTRLASRALLGVGRTGGAGENWSGDLCVAFSTANRGFASDWITDGGQAAVASVQTLADSLVDSLFYAAIEANEEAIVYSLVAAETMTGADDVVAYALPHDSLVALMRDRSGPGDADSG
jgi:D-aminopeptidase